MATTETTPTYKNLFGSDSYYTVDPARSVLSPAAYFVELMKLVDENIMGSTLEERRPDLKTIVLDKKNTDDETSKLEIVNKVLKTKLGSHADNLSSANYPFNLPYDQYLEEIRLYLAQNNTSLAKISQNLALPNAASDSTSLALETLGISPGQWTLYSTAHTTSTSPTLNAVYGLSSGTNTKQDLASVSAFLKQTGLKLDQLQELVLQGLSQENLSSDAKKFFINDTGEGKDAIAFDSSMTTLSNLTTKRLDRINRFVRLAQSLGWSFTDLDWALRTIHKIVNTANQDDPFINKHILPYLSWIYTLKKRDNLSVNQACALIGMLKDVGEKEAPSFFKQVFSNSNVPNHDVLSGSPTWNVPQPGSTTTPSSASQKIQNALAAALQLSQDDLLRIANLLPAQGLLTVMNTGITASEFVGRQLNIKNTMQGKITNCQSTPASSPNKYTFTVTDSVGDTKSIVLKLNGSSPDFTFKSITSNGIAIPDITSANVNQDVLVNIDILNPANLAILYRLSMLPQLTGLSIKESLVAAQIKGVKSNLAKVPDGTVMDALNALTDFSAWLKASPFSVYQLQFILTGQSDDPAIQNKVLGVDAVTNFITDLNKSLDKAYLTEKTLFQAIKTEVHQAFSSLLNNKVFQRTCSGNSDAASKLQKALSHSPSYVRKISNAVFGQLQPAYVDELGIVLKAVNDNEAPLSHQDFQIALSSAFISVINPLLSHPISYLPLPIVRLSPGGSAPGETLPSSGSGNPPDIQWSNNVSLSSGSIDMVDGPWGNQNGAFRFNGSNFLSTDNLTLGDEYTISAWVKVKTGQGGPIIKNPATSLEFTIEPDGHVSFNLNIGGINISPSLLQDNEWQHIAFVADTNGNFMYINGTSAKNWVPGGVTISEASLQFGKGFTGTLANLFIFDQALSADQISGLAAHPPVPEVCIRNGQLPNGSTFHGSGGTPSYTTDPWGGDTAITFDGTSEYIELANDDFNDMLEGTIATWIHYDEDVKGAIFAKQRDYTNSYGVFLIGYKANAAGGAVSDTAGILFFQSQNGSQYQLTSTTPLTAGWSHVAIVFSSTGATFYINGQEAKTVTGNFSIPDDTTAEIKTTVGAWLVASPVYLNTQLADFSIFDKALTADQIIGLYDSLVENILFPPSHSTQAPRLVDNITNTLNRYSDLQQKTFINHLASVYHVSPSIADVLKDWGNLNLASLVEEGDLAGSSTPANLLNFITRTTRQGSAGNHAASAPTPTLQKLQQAAQLITDLSLSPAEARHFKVDYQDTSTYPIALAAVQTMQQFKQLAHSFQDTQNNLLGVLKEMSNTTATTQLASLSGWSQGQIEFLNGKILPGSPPASDPVYTVSTIALMQHYFDTTATLGIDIPTLWNLAHANSFNSELANALWAGLQKQYQARPEVLTGLKSRLNEALRDRLVPLAIHKLGNELNTLAPRGLYEYLLIDVEVSGVVETSYVKEAISALQLYIYRCLQHLEPGVTVVPMLNKLWLWMYGYREWQANREVFLYPEDYIQPELRKNKTVLFTKLEDELKQADLTDPDSVSAVFQEYMNGFAEIAQLQIVGSAARDQLSGDIATKQICMVGKTRHQHGGYYYRVATFVKKQSSPQQAYAGLGPSGKFSGSDYISIPAPALNNLTEYTIETWVKFSDITQGTIIAKQYDGRGTWGVLSIGYAANSDGEGTDTAGKLYFHANNSVQVAVSTHTLQQNTWYHIAIVVSANQCLIYINGTSDEPIVGDYSIPDETDSQIRTAIGAWRGGGGGKYLQGEIYRISVWQEALTATAIRESMFQPITGSEPSLKCCFLPGSVQSQKVTDNSSNGYIGNVTGSIAQFEDGPALESSGEYEPTDWGQWQKINIQIQPVTYSDIVGAVTPAFAFGTWYLFWVEQKKSGKKSKLSGGITTGVSFKGTPSYTATINYSHLNFSKRWVAAQAIASINLKHEPITTAEHSTVYPVYFNSIQTLYVPYKGITYFLTENHLSKEVVSAYRFGSASPPSQNTVLNTASTNPAFQYYSTPGEEKATNAKSISTWFKVDAGDNPTTLSGTVSVQAGKRLIVKNVLHVAETIEADTWYHLAQTSESLYLNGISILFKGEITCLGDKGTHKPHYAGSKGHGLFQLNEATWEQVPTTSDVFKSAEITCLPSIPGSDTYCAGTKQNGLFYRTSGNTWEQAPTTSDVFKSAEITCLGEISDSPNWVPRAGTKGLGLFQLNEATWEQVTTTSDVFKSAEITCLGEIYGVHYHVPHAGTKKNGLFYKTSGNTWKQAPGAIPTKIEITCLSPSGGPVGPPSSVYAGTKKNGLFNYNYQSNNWELVTMLDGQGNPITTEIEITCLPSSTTTDA